MNWLLTTLFSFLVFTPHHMTADDEAKGMFFDPNNLTYAECYFGEDYHYFGDRDYEYLSKQNCVAWDEVSDFSVRPMPAFLQYAHRYNSSFFPEERMWHNFCRTLHLDAYQRMPQFNNASAHLFVNFDGWTRGPWCYIKAGGIESSGKSEKIQSNSYSEDSCRRLAQPVLDAGILLPIRPQKLFPAMSLIQLLEGRLKSRQDYDNDVPKRRTQQTRGHRQHLFEHP